MKKHNVEDKADVIVISRRPGGYFGVARREMLKYIPFNAMKILDAGCGEGVFGSLLKKHTNEVWGIEIEKEAAMIAQTKLDRVIIGDIVSAISELPDSYFDCIVFNDVLEHLVDPYIVLGKIKIKLSSNGVIVCSIPNVRYFDNLKDLIIRKQWKYQEWGILDKTHLRFFTEKSINEMFIAMGYEILKIEGITAIKPSWKFNLLNAALLGYLNDTKYLQYACVVKKTDPLREG